MIWLIVLMFIGVVLSDNKEWLYIQLDKVRYTNKEVCSNINNKYEKGTGLVFESLDKEDDIKDFQMDKPQRYEVPEFLKDGLYGKVEDENLFSFRGKRVPKMDIQLLASRDITRDVPKDCPPIIAKHFFNIIPTTEPI